MGQLVYIKAKKKSIKTLNRILVEMLIQNSFTTEDNVTDWLQDINMNSTSHQKHLKPKDRDLTMDELKQMFPLQTEIGLLSFDVAFSRCSNAMAKKYLKFICENVTSIDYIQDIDAFIERYKVTSTQHKTLILLNKITPEPLILPKEEQYKPDLQGGLLLCKSWSIKPFWVIFGKTIDDRPQFLKTRIYEDDIYNNIYHDKAGYAYLLIPLMPLNNEQVEFVEKVYSECWDMGLRESYTYFVPFIYGMDVVNINEIAEDFKEYYTGEELRERFWAMFRATESIYHYNSIMGFVWRDLQGMFVPTGFGGLETSAIRAKCSVLTALLRAIGPEVSADIMTNLTGKVHRPFEFDMDKFISERKKLKIK